jgi:omega-amidase
MNSSEEKLTVSLVQHNLKWEDSAANRNAFSDLFKDIPETDLVILPEMFSTGFSMDSKSLAETMEGPTIQWMKSQAEKYQAALCGSLIIKEQQAFYNRFVFVAANGELRHYDKKHLFRMSNEHQFYQAGNSKITISLKGFRIRPQICYDLRFPVWSRNSGTYDLLIYVANWPKKRREHWLSLLQARAIENQSYVIGLNRLGIDGNEIEYSGDSCIFDYDGNCLLNLESQSSIQTLTLRKTPLIDYRRTFPAWMDAEKFIFIE